MVGPCNIGMDRPEALFVPIFAYDGGGYVQDISSGDTAEGVIGMGELVATML
jgi:hypothetical protein